jgi:hypothetical protein
MSDRQLDILSWLPSSPPWFHYFRGDRNGLEAQIDRICNRPLDEHVRERVHLGALLRYLTDRGSRAAHGVLTSIVRPTFLPLGRADRAGVGSDR